MTASLFGMNGETIEVETFITSGFPGIYLVGLPDRTICESIERIKAAFSVTGLKFPNKRITVNLSPASAKKIGSHFDLPIAVSILLASYEHVVKVNSNEYALFGELALNGDIKPIHGALPLVLGTRNINIKKIILPYENLQEVSLITDMELLPVKSLSEVVSHFIGEKKIKSRYLNVTNDKHIKNTSNMDFTDIKGQDTAKRAIEIAVSGSHNILMTGSPGAGKTMMAKSLPSIMPELTYDELLEITKIYSISGLYTPFITRPFRDPHHTITASALAGGGANPLPGEVSLAHRGILFLDELPEFKRNILEILRQPLEDGYVTIARKNGTYVFPSKFMLVGSMNPCSCGYYGDPNHKCSCSISSIHNYRSKISGPLMDRMDIHIQVEPVAYKELSNSLSSESSEIIRSRVEAVRDIQSMRYKEEGIFLNGELTPSLMKKYCIMENDAEEIFASSFKKLGLSGRGYAKSLKVARTIADLEKKTKITKYHIMEALQYRSTAFPDRI